MAVIGPNGKDLFPVALIFERGINSLEVCVILVEALSEDEAYGLGVKASREILRDIPSWRKCVSVSVGDSETYEESKTRFRCK